MCLVSSPEVACTCHITHAKLINPLTTDDECTYHATLAACYQLAQSVLKIVFVLAKKSGIRGGGQISAWGAVHMVAALAGCRKALVGTGLGTSRLFDTSRP